MTKQMYAPHQRRRFMPANEFSNPFHQDTNNFIPTLRPSIIPLHNSPL